MPDTSALISAIEKAESESYGSGLYGNDGSLSEDRARALDAYFGRNTLPAPEGHSQLVSRDVYEAVETILPSMVKVFAGSDEVVKVSAVGPNDVEAAEQESMYLNHVATQELPWEQIIHDFCWDGLVTKNAYLWAYQDQSKNVEYEVYYGQSEDAFTRLVTEDGVEVIEHSAEVDEEGAKQLQEQFNQQWQMWQQAAMQAQQQGMEPPSAPQPPQAPMLHDLKLRRVKENDKPSLRVLPPEQCLIHESTPDHTLRDCPFFEYWEETTISDLRQMGFDVADDVADDGETDSLEEDARELYNETRNGDSDGWEPSMRKVRVRMVWIRHDYDGDGIAELQYCIVVGKQVLFREEANRIPVASWVPTPVPHKHIGVSVADVTIDIGETKTQMLRQGVDNLFHANNPRLFINEGKIDLDDALVSRPGGVVRGKVGEQAVFGNDIAPIVIPNIFPQAVQGLEYMDQIRENRTGTNRYFTGTDQNALNKTAAGMSMLTGMSAQRVEQYCRMAAPAIEYAMSCLHELILKHGKSHKGRVIRMRNKWVEVDPTNWRDKRDLKIAVGLGSGSRDAMMAHLNQILAMQMNIGMPLGVTDPRLVYNALAELTKAAGFPTEGQFWKQPEPQGPSGPPPEVQLEQMKQQFEAQKLQLQEQSKAQIAQMQAEMDRLKLETDTANAERERELKLTIARMQEATQLTIAQMGQEHSAQMEAFKASNQAQEGDKSRQFERENKAQEDRTPEVIQNLQEAMQALAQMVQGSKAVALQKIVGPDGKRAGYRVQRADGSVEEVPIQ